VIPVDVVAVDVAVDVAVVAVDVAVDVAVVAIAFVDVVVKNVIVNLNYKFLFHSPLIFRRIFSTTQPNYCFHGNFSHQEIF
jgi:hypothetical protein